MILACLDPTPSDRNAIPNPEPIFFAASDLDAIFARARQAGCLRLDEDIAVQHWGERAFFAEDPFGNPIYFVDEMTLYTGLAQT